MQWGNLRITPQTARILRENAGALNGDILNSITHPVAGTSQVKIVTVKMPAEAEEKYFSGMKAKERTELVIQALDAWIVGKEAADV